jgi:hypothetical protein
VVEYLKSCDRFVVEEVTIVDEQVRFSLPRELRNSDDADRVVARGI